MEMEIADVTIVGAGWHGLAAAKTYTDVNNSLKIIVLDEASSVGGVWAKQRLYSGLKTNNLFGTYEYSDFPMSEERFGAKFGKHIPGEIVHKYLQEYTKEFGLADKIRLNSKVVSAEYTPEKHWILMVKHQEDGSITTQKIRTEKLIMATGLTSQPFMPDFEGQGNFGAPLFHFRDFSANEKTIKAQGTPVTVLGGTKSAWDAVYSCASSGICVDWVIRESGHGPVWMTPPFVTPLKKWLEKLPTTRFLTLFSPCIWGNADGFQAARRFLHGTWIGRKIVDGFWAALKMDIMRTNKYDQHVETKKLKPWVDPFWVATSFSILNYPTDFFEHVKNGNIKIHIADISQLSSNTVHLSNGEKLFSGALISCTGWKSTPDIKFLPEGIDKTLGLPWSEDVVKKDMIDRVRAEIFEQFPRLKDQPNLNKRYQPMSKHTEACVPHSFRLARFMVPPTMLEDRSIVYLGCVMTFNTSLLAQTQALWAAAYLENRLSLLSSGATLSLSSSSGNESKSTRTLQQRVLSETALHTEFGRFRYPGGFGKRNPDFAFDVLPYLDMLLKDLGLRSRRKSSFWANLFQAHAPVDYLGLTEEWKAIQMPPS
ncbi:hypothetical protein FQN57_000869 [Myotisia sp. PD_48]|nr:hypothetical protein FQN57_000869 [Myotisia sp. PD_48]